MYKLKCGECGAEVSGPMTPEKYSVVFLQDSVQITLVCKECGGWTVFSYSNPIQVYCEKDRRQLWKMTNCKKENSV